MIEGMVMELYKDHVIVMTKSGEFLKLRKRGSVNIGDIYKDSIYRRVPVLTYAAAAVLIFVFTSMAGYTAYANQIVGYVDIKGNKDVRLYVSRNGNVKKVDGVKDSNQIKNLPVYEAVEKLNTIASTEGIYNNSSEVEISTTEVKDSKLDFNRVNENVKKILTQDSKSNKGNSNSTLKGNSSSPAEKDNNNGKIKNDNTKQNNSNIDNNIEKGNNNDKNNSKDTKDESKIKSNTKNTSSSNNKYKNDKKNDVKGNTNKFWNFWH